MSSEIYKLLASSARFSRSGGNDRNGGHGFPSEVLDFLSETVTAAVEESTPMSEEEATTLLLDAGLGDLDSDDLQILAQTISLMTGGCDDEKNSTQSTDVEDDDGTCELCERDVRRTFHHLIPRETHSKYLKKKTLPDNLKEIATDIGIDSSMSKVWLNMYGVMICRPCHSAVHLAAPNDVLAEQYNTLDLLLSNPQIYAFAKYNSKQPVRGRCMKKGTSK